MYTSPAPRVIAPTATLVGETATANPKKSATPRPDADNFPGWAQFPATRGRPSLLQLCLSLEPNFSAYHAAWEFALALHGGIAGGADIILIPEIPFDYDRIATAIEARDAAGYLGSLVVVAEGAKPKDGQQVMRETKDGEFRLGGMGEIVAREIAKRTGKETRSCVLGHLQRGGAPTTLDRILGTRFGVKAVQLANEGHFGSMVSYQNYQVRHVPIAEAVNRLRLVPPNGEMVQTARDVEISFGD